MQDEKVKYLSGDAAQEVYNQIKGMTTFLIIMGAPPKNYMSIFLNGAAFDIACAVRANPNDPDLKRRTVELVQRQFEGMIDCWLPIVHSMEKSLKLAEAKPKGNA